LPLTQRRCITLTNHPISRVDNPTKLDSKWEISIRSRMFGSPSSFSLYYVPGWQLLPIPLTGWLRRVITIWSYRRAPGLLSIGCNLSIACSYHGARLDRVVISMMPESGCTSEAFAILYANNGLRRRHVNKAISDCHDPRISHHFRAPKQYQCKLSSWQVTTELAV
jgi:hypothetical protein